MEGATVNKGEFARLINVSPGRVSQYISEGKLYGPALVGDGRNARIAVEVAIEQLRNKLEISQRLGNGINTRLGQPKQAASIPAAYSSPEVGGSPPAAVTLEDHIKAEKLDALRRARRREEEDDRVNAGRYIRTEDVATSSRRLVGALLEGVEGGLSSMAQVLAARFELPQRDVLHLLRCEFRSVRADLARRMKIAASSLPVVQDDPYDEF